MLVLIYSFLIFGGIIKLKLKFQVVFWCLHFITVSFNVLNLKINFEFNLRTNFNKIEYGTWVCEIIHKNYNQKYIMCVWFAKR